MVDLNYFHLLFDKRNKGVGFNQKKVAKPRIYKELVTANKYLQF